mmetsp:Transcript_35686/g.76096  ORF Transcript_35686/g.76096 Transcript_35686/m.76096 type:complete len:290 (+) Transcript_35686:342-1211(+)
MVLPRFAGSACEFDCPLGGDSLPLLPDRPEVSDRRSGEWPTCSLEALGCGFGLRPPREAEGAAQQRRRSRKAIGSSEHPAQTAFGHRRLAQEGGCGNRVFASTYRVGKARKGRRREEPQRRSCEVLPNDLWRRTGHDLGLPYFARVHERCRSSMEACASRAAAEAGQRHGDGLLPRALLPRPLRREGQQASNELLRLYRGRRIDLWRLGRASRRRQKTRVCEADVHCFEDLSADAFAGAVPLLPRNLAGGHGLVVLPLEGRPLEGRNQGAFVPIQLHLNQFHQRCLEPY